MPAYIVITREKTRKQAAYNEYTKAVRSTLEGHNATPLALGGRHEVMEGAPTEGVYIISFPTYEEAVAWYTSPAYQNISEKRQMGSDHRYLIVEGVAGV